jgi:hypothetical protein
MDGRNDVNDPETRFLGVFQQVFHKGMGATSFGDPRCDARSDAGGPTTPGGHGSGAWQDRVKES